MSTRRRTRGGGGQRGAVQVQVGLLLFLFVILKSCDAFLVLHPLYYSRRRGGGCCEKNVPPLVPIINRDGNNNNNNNNKDCWPAAVTTSCGPASTAVLAAAAAAANKGFGGGGFSKKKGTTNKNKKRRGRSGGKGMANLIDDDNKVSSSSKKRKNKPFVRSEQEGLLEDLASRASRTCVGRAVSESTSPAPESGSGGGDPFWELMPSLISSRFPQATDEDLTRVGDFVRHTLLDPADAWARFDEEEILSNPWRPQEDIHAYMPGLGPTEPFYDADQLELCRLLSENYATITSEYHALLDDMESPGGKDRFQSVTSMNYESGWKTLVLFYNGHRIPDFPYHLCPTTTRILETVPLAGRIAGFNRQRPRTGIPMHTDGNNMWLTCQMGIQIPENDAAYIRVGPETRRWKAGECLLYDTTYQHETMNEHESQERVVLHVDFFNTLAMTHTEIMVLQYIYSLREEFMKAEGAAKVGAQIL